MFLEFKGYWTWEEIEEGRRNNPELDWLESPRIAENQEIWYIIKKQPKTKNVLKN